MSAKHLFPRLKGGEMELATLWKMELQHYGKITCNFQEKVLAKNMDAEEILKHSYELHCCECGEVMSIFEDPKLLTSAPFPCPGCYTQTESINMNETVIAFYPLVNALSSPPKITKTFVIC